MCFMARLNIIRVKGSPSNNVYIKCNSHLNLVVLYLSIRMELVKLIKNFKWKKLAKTILRKKN